MTAEDLLGLVETALGRLANPDITRVVRQSWQRGRRNVLIVGTHSDAGYQTWLIGTEEGIRELKKPDELAAAEPIEYDPNLEATTATQFPNWEEIEKLYDNPTITARWYRILEEHIPQKLKESDGDFAHDCRIEHKLDRDELPGLDIQGWGETEIEVTTSEDGNEWEKRTVLALEVHYDVDVISTAGRSRSLSSMFAEVMIPVDIEGNLLLGHIDDWADRLQENM